MDLELALAIALAAAVVVLTPGPAVLALVGLGAAQGRRAGAGFIFGHLAGDMLWAAVALASLFGLRTFMPGLFTVLSILCAGYLGYLGLKAVAAREGEKGVTALRTDRPVWRGILFGITNPKGYPITLALFTSLIGGRADQLDAASLPLFFAIYLAACVASDLLLIWIIGWGPLRRAYKANELWVVRATGALFLAFALNIAIEAWL
jgi:threonine/homoserine/homoserine lactone efflux protein